MGKDRDRVRNRVRDMVRERVRDRVRDRVRGRVRGRHNTAAMGRGEGGGYSYLTLLYTICKQIIVHFHSFY